MGNDRSAKDGRVISPTLDYRGPDGPPPRFPFVRVLIGASLLMLAVVCMVDGPPLDSYAGRRTMRERGFAALYYVFLAALMFLWAFVGRRRQG